MFSKAKTKKKRDTASLTASIYYASDVHGSEQCWRKFLGAGRFYGVEALVMGGDLTGKAIVPIARQDDGTYAATFLGEAQIVRGESELEDLLKAVRYNGMYPWVASADEIAAHAADEAARERLFDDVMLAELARWIELADARMSEYGIATYVMAGNDDPWACDAVIGAGRLVQLCEVRVVRVGCLFLISLC